MNKISEDLLKLSSLFGIQLQLDVDELIIFLACFVNLWSS